MFMKRIFILILTVVILAISTVGVFAQSNNESLTLEKMVKNIGMSVKKYSELNGMTEKELRKLKKKLDKEANQFNNNMKTKYFDNQNEIQNLISQDIEKAKKMLPKLFLQENKNSTLSVDNEGTVNIMSSNSPIGTFGDIILSGSSSSSLLFVGHACVVSTNSNITIESYLGSFSPIGVDGVQEYENDWGSKTGVAAFWVKDATLNDYWYAARYNEQQVGKPYNLVFVNKFTTDKFYCSQLTWRSWLEQGFNIDAIPFDTWVTPAEIGNDGDTYAFYYQE